jgi:hypothetical protein
VDLTGIRVAVVPESTSEKKVEKEEKLRRADENSCEKKEKRSRRRIFSFFVYVPASEKVTEK